MSEVKFKLAAGTNVGLFRKNNEDNFVVNPDLSTFQWMMPMDENYIELGPYGTLLVVADGMGGMNAGEVASAIAVETIQQLFTPEALAPIIGDSKSVQNFMQEAVKAADLNILNKSKEDDSTQGMGTTIVMAWILGRRAYVCWCGDSRCYVYNQKHGLLRLSKDHSYVQELIDHGELEPQYANDHPLSNIITRCLGNEEKRAEPETRIYELYNGDIIMLCSDGLSSLCNDEIIAEVIHEFKESPQECRNELISAALSKGGHDNVTVAVCSVCIEGEENDEDSPDSSFNGTDGQTANEASGSDTKEVLSDTLRNTPVRRNHHTVLWLSLLFLIAIIAILSYLYFTDNPELTNIIQSITSKK